MSCFSDIELCLSMDIAMNGDLIITLCQYFLSKKKCRSLFGSFSLTNSLLLGIYFLCNEIWYNTSL